MHPNESVHSQCHWADNGCMVRSRLEGTVRSARERVGWSREALAYHSGLSGAAIAQIESGRRREVRVTTLLALSRALEVSVDYLVGSRPEAVFTIDGQVVQSTVVDANGGRCHDIGGTSDGRPAFL